MYFWFMLATITDCQDDVLIILVKITPKDLNYSEANNRPPSLWKFSLHESVFINEFLSRE